MSRLDEIRTRAARVREDDALAAEIGVGAAVAPGCAHQRDVGAPCSRCWQTATGAEIRRAAVGLRVSIPDHFSPRAQRDARRARRQSPSPSAVRAYGRDTLTPAELAERAGCARQTVANAIASGQLAAETAGRRHLISAPDADRWCAAREARSALSASEVARRAGCPVKTVTAAIASGELLASRSESRFVVDPASARSWLAEHGRAPAESEGS